MKVLLITKSFKKGGSSTGATNLAEALRVAGIEVLPFDAYQFQNSSALGAFRLVERVAERLFFDPETHCLRLGGPVFDVRRLVEKFRPDIVQLCDISGNVIRFSDLRELGCPIIHRMSDFWPYHGPCHYATDPNDGGRLARWLLQNTVFSGRNMPDVLVSPSQWLCDTLKLPNSDETEVVVIPNSVAVLEAPNNSTSSLSECVRFGFISNQVLDPRKGFRTLPLYLRQLTRKGLSVELHVFGRIKTSEQIEMDGIDVHYHGSFSFKSRSAVFELFDILLCPSRLDNSPNVVCEALAFGRPVLGQVNTGMESYLTDHTGALVDYWSGSDGAQLEFAHAVSELICRYKNASEAAWRYAKEELSYSKVGEAYADLYKRCVTIQGRS